MTKQHSAFEARGLQFAFPGEAPFFESLTFTLSAASGARLVGLVGPNGCGKSTLLRLLAGVWAPTRGHLGRRGRALLLPQEEPPEHEPASGGEWMRARLDAFFSQDADVYLLDEPTHHLDAAGRAWLTTRLARLVREGDGRLVIVASHDGGLLSRCDAFLHLHPPGATLHGGPYAQFRDDLLATRARLADEARTAGREAKAARREAQEKVDRQAKRMRAGKRDAAKGGLPAILVGMRKRNAEHTAGRLLKKQEALLESARAKERDAVGAAAAFAREERPWTFGERCVPKGASGPSKRLVALEDVNVLHGGLPLWRTGVTFGLHAGARVHLSGPNGAGKSTALALLAGVRAPDAGRVQLPSSVRARTVLLAQKPSEEELGLTLLAHARAALPSVPEGALRERLGAYGFRGDAVFRTLQELSGGERVRVRVLLLSLAFDAADVLLLDEPSNHLDILAQEALVERLESYAGALVVVSHDALFTARLAWTETWTLPERASVLA